ncbi:hypothetical protein [Streptomyces sp. NPDC052292]|uniref:hypothetical protein n=1 Tax=Streptomyces sp. NPDC052292 TaxID=3155053 RepID=UPI003430C9C8
MPSTPARRTVPNEVNRPDRTVRRLFEKSDPLDALAAARAVLSGRAQARAKSSDGPVHSAGMYKLAKDSAVKARTQAINQLKAFLVIADPTLRERLSNLGNAELFRTCARLGPRDGGGTRTWWLRPASWRCACSPNASNNSPGRSMSSRRASAARTVGVSFKRAAIADSIATLRPSSSGNGGAVEHRLDCHHLSVARSVGVGGCVLGEKGLSFGESGEQVSGAPGVSGFRKR